MPVKKRAPKARRLSPAEEASAWYDVFSGGSFLLAGHDRELGIEFRGRRYEGAQPTPDYHAWREEVLIPAARAAWGRLGRALLDGEYGTCGRNDTGDACRWALAMFEEPEQCQ